MSTLFNFRGLPASSSGEDLLKPYIIDKFLPYRKITKKDYVEGDTNSAMATYEYLLNYDGEVLYVRCVDDEGNLIYMAYERLCYRVDFNIEGLSEFYYDIAKPPSEDYDSLISSYKVLLEWSMAYNEHINRA